MTGATVQRRHAAALTSTLGMTCSQQEKRQCNDRALETEYFHILLSKWLQPHWTQHNIHSLYHHNEIWKYDGFITTGPICLTLIWGQKKLDSFRAPAQLWSSVSNTLPVTSSFSRVFSCTSSFLSFYLCLRPFFSWRLLRSSCLCFMNKLKKERKRTVKWRLTRRMREAPSCFLVFFSNLRLHFGPFWKNFLTTLFTLQVWSRFDCWVAFLSQDPKWRHFLSAGQACHQMSQGV